MKHRVYSYTCSAPNYYVKYHAHRVRIYYRYAQDNVPAYRFAALDRIVQPVRRRVCPRDSRQIHETRFPKSPIFSAIAGRWFSATRRTNRSSTLFVAINRWILTSLCYFGDGHSRGNRPVGLHGDHTLPPTFMWPLTTSTHLRASLFLSNSTARVGTFACRIGHDSDKSWPASFLWGNDKYSNKTLKKERNEWVS